MRASMPRLTPRFSAERMLREYVEYYVPAAAELAARTADGAARAVALDAWSRRLVTHWSSLRFGRLDVQDDGAEWRVVVEVYLDDLLLDDVAVDLYADPVGGQNEPACIVMRPLRALPGTAHGHLFHATLGKGRPAADYTPRIRPSAAPVAIPLELPLVTWQR